MLTTYYKLSGAPDRTTDKAIGIITQQLTCKRFVLAWIPKIIIRQIDGFLYVPAFILADKDLWGFVNMESKLQMETECKKRTGKSKEEKEMEKYKALLADNFGNEIPDVYVLYVYPTDKTDYRFTNIDRLQSQNFMNKLENAGAEVYIVRDGKREKI